jgi:hypothetical protein
VTDLRFETLVAGGYHTCGLTAEGALHCWGRDGYGELRRLARERCGDTRCARTPVRVVAHGVTAAAVGLGGTCVATNDGVRCWGESDPGLDIAEPAPPITSNVLRRVWSDVAWTVGSFRRLIDRNLAPALEGSGR